MYGPLCCPAFFCLTLSTRIQLSGEAHHFSVHVENRNRGAYWEWSGRRTVRRSLDRSLDLIIGLSRHMEREVRGAYVLVGAG